MLGTASKGNKWGRPGRGWMSKSSVALVAGRVRSKSSRKAFQPLVRWGRDRVHRARLPASPSTTTSSLRASIRHSGTASYDEPVVKPTRSRRVHRSRSSATRSPRCRKARRRSRSPKPSLRSRRTCLTNGLRRPRRKASPRMRRAPRRRRQQHPGLPKRPSPSPHRNSPKAKPVETPKQAEAAKAAGQPRRRSRSR